MSSVASQVARRGTAILLASLALLGVTTGAALHLQALEALDGALLAAAHGHAHPEVADAFEVEHSRNPVEAWVVERDDPRVPEALLARVLDEEAPVYRTVEGTRLLLLPAEQRRGPHEQHVVVAARTPTLGLRDTVGGFALTYSVVSLVVAALAGSALRSTVHRSFAPLLRARREAEGVLGLGQGQRLTAEAPEEVASLLVAVNGLLDRLDTAWAAQARFTREAAHELRTPVAAMLGEIEVVLRRDRSAPEYRAALESAHEEVQRLRRIVEALTALARLDAGEAERSRVRTDAAAIVAAALAAEAVQPPPAVSVPEALPLEANVALVELALGNLLRNAARHAPGAPVEVRVLRRGDRVRFEVHDGGAGVPEAEREQVFAHFGRAAEARRRDPTGLGLGLAFAREVARRHGGDCTIEPSPLGGACAVLEVRAPA